MAIKHGVSECKWNPVHRGDNADSTGSNKSVIELCDV